MNILSLLKSKKPTPVITTDTTTDTQKKLIPQNHISGKKKNTYKIMFGPFTDYAMFELSKTTPLAIIEINGVRQNTSSGWISAKDFPNPCASEMARNHRADTEIMGEKLATTIIEYLDKDTNKPVIQIYPGMFYVFDEYESDYMSHLNHKSRRDLQYQMNLREKLWAEFAKSQNQK